MEKQINAIDLFDEIAEDTFDFDDRQEARVLARINQFEVDNSDIGSNWDNN